METNRVNEIILYQPDDTLALDVRVEDDSVWLTQAQMAELFQATKQNISLHIRNIYKEGELDEMATVKDYLTVQKKLFAFSKMEVMTGSELLAGL